MKKALALLLVILALTGLCACGKSADRAPSEGTYAITEEAYEVTDAAPLENGAPESAADFSVGSAGGTAGSSADIDTSKIIYTGHAEIETLEFDACCEAVQSLIEQTGGFLEASSLRGGYYHANSLRSAEYTIRIPRESFESVTAGLSELGHVSHCSITAENVAGAYYDTESRLAVYRTEEERLLAMLEKAETVEDMLDIEDRLAEVRYNIESLTTDLRGWDGLISYSTLHLTIEEVEEIVETEEIGYWANIARGFSRTLRGIGRFFSDLLEFILISLPVLVLLGVIALVVILLIRRRKRRAAKPNYPPQTYTTLQDKTDKTE